MPLKGQTQYCGAKTRNGGTCKRPPLNGANRCKYHGGMTPSGTTSPHYKHGKKTKAYMALPLTIRKALEAQDDSVLVSLNKELASQVGLVDETLEELGEAYQKKSEVTSEDEVFLAKKSINKIQGKLRQLITERGYLVMQEHKRQMDLKGMIDSKGLVLLINTFLETVEHYVREIVEDRDSGNKVIAGIARHIDGLLGGRVVIENDSNINKSS